VRGIARTETRSLGVLFVPTTLVQRLVIAICMLATVGVPLTSVLPSSAQGSNYRWAVKQTPFTVMAGANLTGDWSGIMTTAVNQWDKNDTVTIKKVSGTTGAQQCSPTTGRIEICNWNYGTNEGWLGLTRLYFDDRGNRIEAATLQLNDSFFNQKNGQYNDYNARLHTMCHEMGHTIGLEHVDTTSCMNDSQYAVFHYVKPINKDFRDLERIYKNTDSYTTVDGKQKNEKKDKKKKKKHGKKNNKKKQDSRDKARQRKKELRKKRANSEGIGTRETVNVERMADGTTVVTYITWAE
jgi:predicted Zn-dependent protease